MMLISKKSFLILSMVLFVALAILTIWEMKALPASFAKVLSGADKVQLLDRSGIPLSVTYQNRWNVHDPVPLHKTPEFLQQAFIQSEDKRFYQHEGQDWLARFHALYQNVINLRKVRGASTISEQVVRMLHPRSRTLWSRWLEGWEAHKLEQIFSKSDILEFYLNQVPYAANRRGIQQAARYYFDRDLETLSKKEMLALAVLVRAPSRLDIYTNPEMLEKSIIRLAESLVKERILSEIESRSLAGEPFQVSRPDLSINASHFVRYALEQSEAVDHRLVTTLDGNLQNELQALIDQRLQVLQKRHVENAGLLVVDHQNGEILAWVVGGAGKNNKPGSMIDSISAYRQPGSALKPFLYALALENDWTAATLIDDSPLSESVGYGLHQYRNYSRVFYGPVSVREALGNSLNIPALRTIQYAGADNYLQLLRDLGFRGLNRHPEYYGDGLALGNAEVSLLELVQAYAVLANKGVFKPLRVLKKESESAGIKRVLSAEVSSLIGNILSDPSARQLEFGSGTLLNLPVQTAVKTGTSSDFRDSWTVGYNDRYVVGLWMGNLDNKPTDGVTGSSGPALVLRSVFSLLNLYRQTQPLYLSPKLVKKEVCSQTGLPVESNSFCVSRRTEYFIPGSIPNALKPMHYQPGIRLRQPTAGLHLAVDPRLPLNKQAFEFVLAGVRDDDRIEWLVDGRVAASSLNSRYLWPLQRGRHVVQAMIFRKGRLIHQTPKVSYLVK